MALLVQLGTYLNDNGTPIIQAGLGVGLSFDGTDINVAQVDVQWSVLDILNTPPVSPSDGDTYLVGTSGTGAWSGHNNEIATWNAGGSAWTFQSASIGDLLYDDANATVYKWTGTTWVVSGKIPIVQGGNTLGTQMIIGTIDNTQMRIRTHNINRISIANNGDITLNKLTGTGNQVVGIDATGLLSRTSALTSTLTNTHIFVGNSSNVATDVAMSGDATISNIGALTLATVLSVLTKGSASKTVTITTDAKGRITALSDQDILITESQVTNLVSDLAAKLSTTLTNTHILVGNGSNIATDVAMSGDATIANTGAVTLKTVLSVLTKGSASKSVTITTDAQGRITALSDQDIAVAAGQVALTNTHVLVGNAGNVAADVAMSGDATIANTGALTLATILSVLTKGSASKTVTLTTDVKGRITALSDQDIQITESQVTNLTTDLAAKQSTTLTSAHILVGNSSNVATDVAMSGDATISNTGVVTVASYIANNPLMVQVFS